MSTVQAHGDRPWPPAPGGDPVSAREDAARTRSAGTRLPGLDGLRALAVTAVLIFHAIPRGSPAASSGSTSSSSSLAS